MRQIFILILTLGSTLVTFSQEICNNSVDDDGDLMIDLNDSDCACSVSGSGNPTSIIPNPSFEDMACCPSNFSQLNCASQWVQATDATSDYLNTCGFLAAFGAAPYLPFPDGNGAAGIIIQENWSEYLGTCLLNPMIAGTQYTLQMEVILAGTMLAQNLQTVACDYNTTYSTLDLVIFGHPSCGNFTLPTLGCPLDLNQGYIELGTASLDLLTYGYQTITFNFTPTFDVEEVVIGPPCTYPLGWSNNLTVQPFVECSPYLIVDNLILNASSSFNFLVLQEQGALCSNNLVLVSSVAAAGGVYQWFQNGIALIGQTNSTLNISNLALSSGTYQVTYTVNGECYQDEITVNGTATSSLEVNDAIICQGDSTELNVSGGINYSWSPAFGLSSATGAMVIASPNQTTSYTVSSTDINGCVSEATSIVTVLNSPNDVEIVVSPIPVETDAILLATPLSYSYTWTNPEGVEFNINPLTYQFPEGEGNFLFTVEAENELGCTFTETIQISITSDLVVYVPNSFSPDFDEHNNVFNAVISDNIDAQAYSLMIYNRWGELIFESLDPAIGWDGTYDGNLVQNGVYSWTLKVKLANKDDRRIFTGSVNVLR